MKKLLLLLILMLFYLFPEYQEVFIPWMEFSPLEFQEEYDEDLYYLSLYPKEDQSIIKSVHYRYGVPIKYLYRLHYIESKFNQGAIRHENNGSVSIGYGQLNNSNSDYFAKKFNNGKSVNFYNKRENIRISVAYISYLYNRLGNWEEAFMAYNCGIGRVLRYDVPEMAYEYSLAIMHGRKYIEQIKVIKGAVSGII